MNNKSIGAIIMAGGRGKRMNADVDKPLVKLGGLFMIKHLLYALSSVVEIKHIFIVSSEKAKAQYTKISRDFPKIKEIIVQHNPSGTFHAVESTFETLKKYKLDKTIIISGDNPFISPRSITNLIYLGLNSVLGYRGINNNPVLLGHKLNMETGEKVPMNDPVAICGEEDKYTDNLDEIVEDFDEKRSNLYKTEQWHTGGVYCVRFDELSCLKSGREILKLNNKKEYYVTDIFPHLKSPTVIVNVDDTGSLININTKDQLKVAESLLVERYEHFRDFEDGDSPTVSILVKQMHLWSPIMKIRLNTNLIDIIDLDRFSENQNELISQYDDLLVRYILVTMRAFFENNELKNKGNELRKLEFKESIRLDIFAEDEIDVDDLVYSVTRVFSKILEVDDLDIDILDKALTECERLE